MWPALTILTFLVMLALLHLWWRERYHQLQEHYDTQAKDQAAKTNETTRETKQQQEILFNAMLEGLLLLDRQQRIYLVNRAFKQLFSLNTNPQGRTLIEALRLPELATLIDRVEAEGQVMEHEIQLAGARPRFLQANAAIISNTAGKREGMILVFHDLTRLKQLEATRQEFVANVSHELRTPLAMIKGYVETLLAGAKDDSATATKFLQTVERHADRLTLLIEDLLTISSLESGQIQLRPQRISLPEVVEKIFADLKPKADSKKVKLRNETPTLQCQADPHRLQQVLHNLVDNAIKYGRVEGCVTVTARDSGDGLLEITVQDDGPGLPPDSLERVFERFYRVDKARSRDQGGTGLGLSIVKHIIQAHGGTVGVRSESGQGATFFFTLPKV